MGDQGKQINFGDPMYATTWAGKVWAHVTLREVNRSPAAFEEGLRMFVSIGQSNLQGDVPGISDISEY